MTQPANHRDEAEAYLRYATNWHDEPPGDPILTAQLGILHGLLAIHDVLAELRDDDLEERHSERFETAPLRAYTAADGEDLDDTLPRPAYTIDGEDDEHDPRHQRPEGAA